MGQGAPDQEQGPLRQAVEGKCLSTDFEAAYEHMIPFVAAGFRAVCQKRAKR